MHVGKPNPREKYTVNGKTLRNTEVQKNLGKQIHCSLKVATPVEREVKKVCGALAFIGWGTEYNSWQVML